MRPLGLLALGGWLACSGCATTQSVDPSPVLASQTDLASIRQAIAPCLGKAWGAPATRQSTRVTLRWRLDEDGRLLGQPEVIEPQGNPGAPAAQAAIRAVRACEPFRLPVDRYHLWKEIVFNFDAIATPD